MTGFICHDDYLNKTAKLTDEEVGRLFRACMIYHATGEAQELDGRESIAFDFIREDIDRAEKAYQDKCETNRKNRLAKMTTDDDRQRPSTDDDHRQQPTTPVKKSEPKFVKPSVEEVAAYCKERGNNVDPEAFIAFYESKGWKVGAQPMKSWKACIVTWEKRDSNPKQTTKRVVAQQYEQRDYSGVQKQIEDENAREIERKLREMYGEPEGGVWK